VYREGAVLGRPDRAGCHHAGRGQLPVRVLSASAGGGVAGTRLASQRITEGVYALSLRDPLEATNHHQTKQSPEKANNETRCVPGNIYTK
jgi:hypothetical protein